MPYLPFLVSGAIWGCHIALLKRIWPRAYSSNPAGTRERMVSILRNSPKRPVVDFALENGIPLHPETAYAAVRMGELDLAQWLHRTQNLPYDKDNFLSFAVKAGRMNLIEMSLAEGAAITQMTLASAASGGHLELLKWLHERDPSAKLKSAMCAAAREGRIAMLEWLISVVNAAELDVALMNHSPQAPNAVQVVQLLRAHKCPWDHQLAANSAANRKFDLLKWLHQEGCPIKHDAFNAALVVRLVPVA
jgi:hypothetical protein